MQLQDISGRSGSLQTPEQNLFRHLRQDPSPVDELAAMGLPSYE